jgi:hypothetical protein
MAITAMASNFSTAASLKKGTMKKIRWEKPPKDMVKLYVDAFHRRIKLRFYGSCSS